MFEEIAFMLNEIPGNHRRDCAIGTDFRMSLGCAGRIACARWRSKRLIDIVSSMKRVYLDVDGVFWVKLKDPLHSPPMPSPRLMVIRSSVAMSAVAASMPLAAMRVTWPTWMFTKAAHLIQLVVI